MTRRLPLLLAACTLFGADNLPIGGIAHIGFRVADLEKTRAFYTGTLQIEQAYDQKDANGKTTLAVFKINDRQFLEFSPGTPVGFTHLAFLTEKIDTLRQLVDTLGLNPPNLRTGRDRTRNFSIQDPDGHRIEFVQHEPDSMQAQSRGKFVRPGAWRLNHIALPAASRQAALAFFQGQLGFGKTQWPDLIHPPTDATQYIELLPAASPLHICLEEHKTDEGGGRPARLDPDGTRIEFVDSCCQ